MSVQAQWLLISKSYPRSTLMVPRAAVRGGRNSMRPAAGVSGIVGVASGSLGQTCMATSR